MKNYKSRNSCPACEAKNYNVFHTEPYSSDGIKHYLNEFYSSQGFIDFKYLEGMTYKLLQCIDCGLFFQKEVPNDELLNILYDQWIDPSQALERNRTHDLSYRVMRLEEVLSITAHFNKPPHNFDVLDFGMGWGSVCLQFKALGVNAKGIELSQPRIKHAESNGIEVIAWEDLNNISFDFINADDVFEHLVDPLTVLEQLSKSLKPSGIIKISVPNAKVYEKALKKMDWYAKRGTNENLNGVSPLEHINCFYAKSLIKMASKCGLKPTKVEKVKINKKTFTGLMKELYRKHVLNIKSTVIYFTKAS